MKKIDTIQEICKYYLGESGYFVFDLDGKAVVPKGSTVELDLAVYGLHSDFYPITYNGELLGWIFSNYKAREQASAMIGIVLCND